MKIKSSLFLLFLVLISCGKKNSSSEIETKVSKPIQTPEHPVEVAFTDSDLKNKINEFSNSVRLNLFQISKQYFYGIDLNNQKSFNMSVNNPLREQELVFIIGSEIQRIQNLKRTTSSKTEIIDLEILEDYLINQKKLKIIQIQQSKISISHNILAPFYFFNSILEVSDETKKRSFGNDLVIDLVESKYFSTLASELEKMNKTKNLKLSSVDLKSTKDMIKAKEGYILHMEQALEKISNNRKGIDSLKVNLGIALDKIEELLNQNTYTLQKQALSKEEYQATLRVHGVYSSPDKMYELAKKSFALETEKTNKLIEKVRIDLNLPNFSRKELLKYFRDHRSAKTNEDLKTTIDKINLDISSMINQEQIITQPKEDSLVLFAGLETGEFGDILKRRSDHGIPQMIDTLPPYINAPFALWADIAVMKKKTADFMIKDTLHSITAHEGRPGHEMQFRTIMNMKNKSIIRHSMVQNTANVEGWALFAESLIEKHITTNTDKLFYKFNYLLRIVRVITDYEINLGLITKEEGVDKYKELLGVEESTALSEIGRRINSPGRDTGYFMGRLALENLRRKVKQRYSNYKSVCFNDLVLSYSFAPVKYMESFINNTSTCLGQK